MVKHNVILAAQKQRVICNLSGIHIAVVFSGLSLYRAPAGAVLGGLMVVCIQL